MSEADVFKLHVHADANPVTSPSFVFVTVCVMSTLCLHKKSDDVTAVGSATLIIRGLQSGTL